LYNICIAITRDKFVYLSRLKIKNNWYY
jgi:hypothetical protein